MQMLHPQQAGMGHAIILKVMADLMET